MRKSWVVLLLFLSVLGLSLGRKAFAQQAPGSLLDTLINETVRQSHSPESNPWYGYDPRSRDDYYDDQYYDARQGKRITCESRGERYNYCRTHMQGRIRLERQLSDAPCRRYDTWGADGDGSGVWVSNGCRATFIVEPRRPPRYGEPGRGGKTQTITCESRGERYNYCRTNTYGRVRLQRQLSDAPCREYYTWGADGDGSGVWVSNGCRATFVVESRRPRHGGYDDDDHHGRSRVFTCKSDGFKSNYCRSGTRGGRIRLVRQLSDASCREYYTWGADKDGGGVWVDQGCSAEFAVERR